MKKIVSFLRSRLFLTCPKTGRLIGLKKSVFAKLFFPLIGLFSLLWLLVRVIPKPSRAAYPCIKIATPLALTFVLWLIGFTGSFFVYKKAQRTFRQSRYILATLLIVVAAAVFTLTFLPTNRTAFSDIVLDVDDPYGPNNPVGEPKGIFPGRVVWAWNPEATNEDCRPDRWGDGYFLDKNCDQAVVDEMLSSALLRLTEAETDESAWDAVFRYFNKRRGKGDVGYAAGEKIFIKINAVHAWTTNNDGSIKRDGNYGNVDTSPQAVLAMLRQLVHKAGVPQENIYIGDPYTHIFTHCLEKWRADFPNIHYMDKRGNDGRERYTKTEDFIMKFSDKGKVLAASEDSFYKQMRDADYVLNIPAMKGHRWGGVTLFGKNFFGANERSGAGHMHPGLHRENYDEPLRGQYGMYRVFVDLLGHEQLGDKILIYFMDALWSCSYEHEPPVKFKMAPFNNDWTSSVLVSLDPLAIESVCLDILQAEFPKEESEEPGNYWYANFPAVDDYLHQAADSQNWPEGIVYDPEGDGTPIGSLGVHEHWNNPLDQQYSRNLGTGEGIELVKVFGATKVVDTSAAPGVFRLQQNYPNPFNPSTTIQYELAEASTVSLTIYNVAGQRVEEHAAFQPAGSYQFVWRAHDVPAGPYIYRLDVKTANGHFVDSKKMTLLK